MPKFDIDEFYIDDLLEIHAKGNKGSDKQEKGKKDKNKKKDKSDSDKKASKKGNKKKKKNKDDDLDDDKFVKKLVKNQDRGIVPYRQSIIIIPPLKERFVDGIMFID